MDYLHGSTETASQVAGSLPAGLTLNPATGTLTGTPTGAGTYYFEVLLTDADGAQAIGAFLSIQINPATTTAANPVPFLNQPLIPSAVAPGSNALTLAVSGTGFLSGATIDFNGTPLTTTFVDQQHLTAALPATDIATAQTASITVVNPSPGGGASNVVFFQVAAPEATVNFANAPNSPLALAEPAALAIADFNQDGKPDLAVTAATKLYMMLSNGNGTFTAASGSPISMPSQPYNDFASPYAGPLAVGDFNHSGHPGLAVAETQNAAAFIFLGNGDGTLTLSPAGFTAAQGQPTSALQAADFNADGNLDLAIVNQYNGVSPVTLGYGDGAFNSAGDLFTGPEGFSTGVAIGDFNRDGKLDAAIATGGSVAYPNSGVSVSLGNGDGTFTLAAGASISLGQNLSAIVAGDFNADGKLDLAATDATGNTVFILLGNGDGTFQSPKTFPVGNDPTAMVVGDFNSDGKLDIAIANTGDGTITLLLGKGDGTFTQSSSSPYLVGPGAASLVAADFNGDGKLDLAVANTLDTTGAVSILLQQ
jgi:hypothetical protein